MRKYATRLFPVVAAVWVTGCKPSAAPSAGVPKAPASDVAGAGGRTAAVFSDATEQAGLRFVLASGATGKWYFPEIMHGGVAVFDYDNDGWLDVYFVQGGTLVGRRTRADENVLYRNIGGGQFVRVAGAGGATGVRFGNGVMIGDYNNDGFDDIYVSSVGANTLYRNNRDGTFTDVTTQAGVGDEGWGTSCAFVDYDADGWLDLYVTNYVRWSPGTERECYSPGGVRDYCAPTTYEAPAPDTLYHNNGDGTFTDVSAACGIRKVFGNGLGVVCGDFDGDGDLDIYVANDQMANQIWINQGDGTFRDEALLAGVAVNAMGRDEASMGLAAEDLDDDGDLDLFMVHLAAETNTLYVNEGGFFEDVTIRTGLYGPSRPYTGFGMGFLDYDCDGRLDVFVGNGRVANRPRSDPTQDVYAEPNQLYRQVAPLRWKDVSAEAGDVFRLVETTRGAAFGDLDNDGDVDIVAVNRDGPARYYRNDVPDRGAWVGFRVVEQHGRDAIGARVDIEVAGKRRRRDVRPAYSYQSCNDPRVHFGLGTVRRIDAVHVAWVDGTTESFGAVDAGRYYLLRKGAGRAEPAEQR